MTKLSDTQTILLSNAAQRPNVSLLPLPASLKPGGGASKAMTALIKAGFAEERETRNAETVRRTDGDLRFGLYLTAAGAEAIGVSLPENDQDVGTSDVGPAAPPAAKPAKKTVRVIALLGRPEGATLADLIAATGWLPHTTRAALTGLRKKGHNITRGKRDGVTCYRIAVAA